MHTVVAPRLPATVTLGLSAWFAAAVVVALAGLARVVGPPIAGAAIFSGVALGLVANRTSPAVRAWSEAVPLRALILYQAVRAPIGAAFTSRAI